MDYSGEPSRITSVLESRRWRQKQKVREDVVTAEARSE